MKIVSLILSAILLSATTSNAQKIHFTDSANYWASSGEGGMDPTCYLCRTVKYGTDSVMYGYSYTLMTDTATSTSLAPCGGVNNRFWIREDTTAGLVYYRLPMMDTLEHILYNYNLQLGDSISYDLPYGLGHLVDSVVQVDSILIYGIFHKTLLIQCKTTSREYLVIEGIGTTNNPYWPAMFKECFEWSEKLVTFRQGTTAPAFAIVSHLCTYSSNEIYSNGTKVCGENTSGGGGGWGGGGGGIGVSEVAQGSVVISISPNPVSDHFNVKVYDGFEGGQLYLFDLAGRRVLNTAISSSAKGAAISTLGLSEGVYIVVIYSGVSIVKRERIVLYKQ